MIGRAGIVAVALVAAVGADVDRLGAQPSTSDASGLRARVERRFDVLPVREGLVLRPRDSAGGIRSVEITGGTIALDGNPATGAELRSRLGAEADLILQLSYLDDAERRALFSPESTIPPPPQAPSIVPPEPPAVVPGRPDTERRESGSRRRSRRGGDDRVRFGGSVNVGADEIVDGDVVAIGGHVNVDGEVRGDVVAVGGGLTLGPRAVVANNVVVVGGPLRRDPGARIGGDIQEVGIGSVDFGRWNWNGNPLSFWGGSVVGSAFALVGTVARVAILCLLAALVILLGREYVERAGARARVEPLKAGAIGLLAQLLFLPILVITVVVLVITIIGIPLLILVPFMILGLALVGMVGFTAVAYQVGIYLGGRLGWKNDNPYLTAVGGILVLLSPVLLARIIGLSGLPLTGFLLFIGILIEYLAWTIGFGSMALLRFSRPRPPFADAVITTAT